jgi:hypothetical protein
MNVSRANVSWVLILYRKRVPNGRPYLYVYKGNLENYQSNYVCRELRHWFGFIDRVQLVQVLLALFPPDSKASSSNVLPVSKPFRPHLHMFLFTVVNSGERGGTGGL